VTGAHLSPEFGLTYREIEADGFTINRKVEMLLSSDTVVGVSKSVGLAITGLAEAFDELQPDIVLLLGDRYEMWAAGAAATVARIPIAHIRWWRVDRRSHRRGHPTWPDQDGPLALCRGP